MAKPLLTLRFVDGVPGVYRLNGTSLTLLGSTFGSLESYNDNSENKGRNRVIQFDGKVYALLNNIVYVYDLANPTLDWQISHSFALASEFSSGLYQMLVNGVPHIVCTYGRPTGGMGAPVNYFRGVKFDGTTWTETGDQMTSGSISSDSTGIFGEIVFKDIFYFAGSSSAVTPTARIISYDPRSQAINEVATVGSHVQPVHPIIFDDKLYFVSLSSTAAFLFRLDANTAVAVGTITAGINSGSHRATWAVFADEYFGTPTMFWVGVNSGGSLQAYRFDATASPVNITNDVIPSGFTGLGVDYRMSCYVDQEANPGGKPEILLYGAGANSGDVATFMKWKGAYHEIEVLGTVGGAGQLGMVNDLTGGGDRVLFDNESNIDILEVENLSGSYRVRIDLKNSVMSPTNVRMSFDKKHSRPRTPATLLSTTDGVIGTDGLVVSGLVPPTVFDVVWDSGGDGILVGDHPSIGVEQFDEKQEFALRPDDINDLRIWLDAADAATVGLNGSDVSSWTDKSLNGLVFSQVTPGNQPLYEISALNGLNGVNYSAGDVLGPVAPPVSLASDNVGEIFIVMEPGSVDLNDMDVFRGVCAAPGSYNFQIRADTLSNSTGPEIRVEVGGTQDAIVVNNQSVAIGVPFIYNVSTNGGFWFLEQDGANIGSTVVAGGNNGDWFGDLVNFLTIEIGNSAGTFSGKIYEIIIYGEPISTSDRQRISNYLKAKWGI